MSSTLEGSRLVFVDEMGTHTSLAPLYAYSPRGKRAFFKVPRNRGKNTTLLASITIEGIGPSIAIEGSMTKEVFEAYVEHFLAPTLRSGQIVVMDNLSAHKGDKISKLIEDRGCTLLYLPSYSPDLNPIEEAFSKVKGLLRRIGTRTREALVEARCSARYCHRRRRPGLLCSLRLPAAGAITMRCTVDGPTLYPSGPEKCPRSGNLATRYRTADNVWRREQRLDGRRAGR